MQIPPAGLLPARAPRAVPTSPPKTRSPHCSTLLALMTATDIHTGEAIGLNTANFDQQAVTLTVTGKYGGSPRATVVDDLADYLRQRQQLLPADDCPALLMSITGRRLFRTTVHPTFCRLADQVGLVAVSPACRPRLHDLRHIFSVNTMLDAYRSGVDPGGDLVGLARTRRAGRHLLVSDWTNRPSRLVVVQISQTKCPGPAGRRRCRRFGRTRRPR